MAGLIQLDFFKTEEESRLEAIEARMDKVEASAGKVRRNLFAKNGELTKLVFEIQERLNILERNICHGNTRLDKNETW